MVTGSTEAWRKRLHIPAYQVGEAARYAQISTQTVTAWHKLDQRMLSPKEKRARLSYLQLIELAVVAAFRKAKFPLSEIRAAREYIQKNLNSEHPFAEYKYLGCLPCNRAAAATASTPRPTHQAACARAPAAQQAH
jgi:hypothetical protein